VGPAGVIAVAVIAAATAAGAGSGPDDSRSNGLKPRIAERPIPFGDQRKRQTARYAERHYGLKTWRLREPKLIVQHMAATSSYDSVHSTFAANERDVEYGERPGVCAHFLVDDGGRIYQFVRTGIICRHTVGLNHVSIGIEHLGTAEGGVLRDRAQRRASLRLTRWLVCRFALRVRDVIGHNESLSSPHYVEHDPDFRGRTHADWPERAMDRYRHKLRRGLDC
jgi:N-acetylmuramoyl-L-alanine amidase